MNSECRKIIEIFITLSIPHIVHSLVQQISIKGNLRRLFHLTGILVKGAISIVRLLLHSRTKLEQVVRYRLTGRLEDVDQSASETLLVVSEHGNGLAGLARTTCPADTVDVVLDLETISIRPRSDYTDRLTVRGNVTLMTTLTAGMSRPLAATSVATSNGTLPCLNASRLAVRCCWLRSP